VQAISGVNLSIVLRSAISLTGALVLMGLTSARLMGVILVLISGGGCTADSVRTSGARLVARFAGPHRDTSGLAGETLNAIQTVQAFTLEELQSERYGQAVEGSFVAAVRRTRVRAMLTALGVALVFGGITFVLWLGARQVLAVP